MEGDKVRSFGESFKHSQGKMERLDLSFRLGFVQESHVGERIPGMTNNWECNGIIKKNYKAEGRM